eukprot:UN06575
MWIEKYRPDQLDEIISHEHILSTIDALIKANRLPHLLFYGPPGTGRTTTGLAVARKLNGKAWRSMTLELNASDERGIDVVRQRIKTFASTKQMFHTGLKLVVLDEADSMTNAAQFAMRRIMEQYTKNTRFILICNYVNKVIPAIQSRCTRFRFSPLDSKSIKVRLNEIVQAERVNIENETVLDTIITLAEGDMRKCLNVLQSAHQAYEQTITSELIYQCTGAPSPDVLQKIWDALFGMPFRKSLSTITEIMEAGGIALADVISILHKKVLRAKISADAKMYLLSEFGDLECRLANAASDSIQIAAFVGMFFITKTMMLKANKKKVDN